MTIPSYQLIHHKLSEWFRQFESNNIVHKYKKLTGKQSRSFVNWRISYALEVIQRERLWWPCCQCRWTCFLSLSFMVFFFVGKLRTAGYEKNKWASVAGSTWDINENQLCPNTVRGLQQTLSQSKLALNQNWLFSNRNRWTRNNQCRHFRVWGCY